MSFFRSVTRNPELPKKIVKAAVFGPALAGAWAGTVLGGLTAQNKKIPFSKTLHVMAKGGLFGAGKGLQYTALPITYPVAKLLESRGYTGTFLQKKLFDLINEAVADASRAEKVHKEKGSRIFKTTKI